MKTWNERLLEAYKESRYRDNQAAFASAVGVSPPTVTDWLNGTIKTLKADSADSICEVLGITLPWLMRGKNPKRPDGKPKLPGLDDVVLVPFKAVKVIGTIGEIGFEVHFEEDETLKPLLYRRDWLQHRGLKESDLAVREVEGSSMEPKLYAGDHVLINAGSTTPKNGVVFQVLVDGRPCVKRLQIKARSEWWITSDNPLHSMYDLPLENSNQIVGEVIQKMSTQI